MPFCNPGSQTGHSNVFFHQLRLPTATELVCTWSKKKASIISYSTMPTKKEFRWSELKSYLQYCDGLGMRAGRNVKEPKSFNGLLLYNDSTPAPWMDIELTDDQIESLKSFKKCWSVLSTKDIKELPRPYSLLILLASTIADCSPEELVSKIGKKFTTKIQNGTRPGQ
jgi:hypothetical protein